MPILPNARYVFCGCVLLLHGVYSLAHHGDQVFYVTLSRDESPPEPAFPLAAYAMVMAGRPLVQKLIVAVHVLQHVVFSDIAGKALPLFIAGDSIPEVMWIHGLPSCDDAQEEIVHILMVKSSCRIVPSCDEHACAFRVRWRALDRPT